MAAPSSLADQQSSFKLQHRVYTPSPSLSLTYTPPPSVQLTQVQCSSAHPGIMSSHPDVDAHTIISELPAHPLLTDMDTHISSPLMPTHHVMPPSAQSVQLDGHVITHYRPAHFVLDELGAHITKPALADQPSLASNFFIFDHYDVKPNDVLNNEGSQSIDDAYDPLHESHHFTIWANGFDPVLPHDRMPGDISLCDISSTLPIHSQFNHCHFNELEQLPSLVPDSPTSGTSEVYTQIYTWPPASKFTTVELLGTRAPTSSCDSSIFLSKRHNPK